MPTPKTPAPVDPETVEPDTTDAAHDAAPPAQPAPAPDADPAGALKAAARERDDARRELGTLRKEVQRLQEVDQARTDAEKSELQKAQDRLAASEARETEQTRRFADLTIRLVAQTEALRLGFRRPERAHREVDLADVRYDEDGQPANLRELLEAELRARPELRTVTPTVPDAGAGERGRTSALTHDQIRQRAREDPDFVREHWDEIREVLGRPGR